jgi:putative heme-binding domain-containing protein
LVKHLLRAPDARLSRHLNLLAVTIPSVTQINPPQGWAELVGKRRHEGNTAAFDRLGAIFGDQKIAERMAKVLADRTVPLEERKAAFVFLSDRRDLDLSSLHLALLEEAAFRSEVIPLLGRYNDKRVAKALLERLEQWTGSDRLAALNALCVQPELAKAHLKRLKKLDSKTKSGLTSLHLRQMRSLGDKEVNMLLDDLWGTVRGRSAHIKVSMEKYRKLVSGPGRGDRKAGKEVFGKVCSVCHVRDGAGGKYGPDLTGSWRNGKDYFLESIVDPNAVIGENFRLNIVTRKDGSPVSGMPVAETVEVLTIQTLTESVAIPKSAIKSRQVLDQSIMPVGLLDTLPEQEVVDLLNYLTTE